MKKRSTTLLLIFTFLFTLSGCGFTTPAKTQSAAAEGNTAQSSDSALVGNASEMFTDRDLEIEYDEETSTQIALLGESASSDSDTVEISGGTITITKEGTYILSGTLDDGMIVVSAGDTDKVQLVLDGVSISNSTSAAIYVLEADKAFITTAPESENTLVNGGEYIPIDDNNIDAVIFSKADLTLNGTGMLTVSATAGHGIVSKDDLIFTSGNYDVIAASHGFSGKDSVRISGGVYTISSGKDAIHAENTDNADLGFLYVADGTFSLTSGGDGMSAGSYLQIEDGDFTITTGEGSASVATDTDSMNFDLGSRFEMQSTAQEDSSISQKGLKADGRITLTGGNFVADTVDDSIHAGGNILITGGTFSLSSGDDAIHSDNAVDIQSGSFTIAYCYEGIEGLSITIDDGSFELTSTDDGLNAAGGADGSGFGGGRPGQDLFSSDQDSFITINGGTFAIISGGDCIDSNGDLTINGGTLTLTCNGRGDTALDCDGTYSNNGGEVMTNDDSENNPGQMGAQGGMGKRRGRK